MQGINKNYNRTGKIVGTAFVLLILLMSFMYRIDPPMKVPEEPKEEVVAVLDFTNAGGGSSGGSESFKETPEEDAAPDKNDVQTDPVPEANTQTDPSPVVTKPSQNSSPSNGSGTSQKPANDFGSIFGGNGGGQNDGSGGGTDGVGVGTNGGPGIGNGIGEGKDRVPLVDPQVKNPTQEVGVVMLELIINRDGKVIDVKVRPDHKFTTTQNKTLLKTAEKAAWDWVFNEDKNGDEKQRVFKTIEFILD